MVDLTFRFDPPAMPSPLPAEMAWVLARAYAQPSPATPGLDAATTTIDPAATVALASSLGLAARLAARVERTRLEHELGAVAAGELAHARAWVVAQELRLQAALADVDAVAAELGVRYAVLKGQALVLAGLAPPGARPSADLDVLVPASALRACERALVARGLRSEGAGYAHQAAPLRHPAGGLVELHRSLPGVRVEPRHPRRSAGLEALRDAGSLESLAVRPELGLRGEVLVPTRPLLVAHALVHGLAQHALIPGRFPGFLLLADLIDLGFAGPQGETLLATIRPWIAREVTPREATAALALATALAAGAADALPPGSDARRLLDHFWAGVTDAAYAGSLAARLLERPLSDLPRPLARAMVVLRALLPPAAASTADGAPTAPADGWRQRRRWLLAVLARPFSLLRRFTRARAAGRR